MQKTNRLERKKARTKNTIFEAAMELFLKHGYDQTTVEEITEKADVAKGTFFNHFPTKDALLSYLGERRIAALEELLMQELENMPSIQDKIMNWLKLWGQFNEQEKEITALVVREELKKSFSGLDPEPELNVRWRNILIQILTKGQRQGEFRTDFNPEHAADILIGIYFITLFQWLENGLHGSLTDELLARAGIVLQGIRK